MEDGNPLSAEPFGFLAPRYRGMGMWISLESSSATHNPVLPA